MVYILSVYIFNINFQLLKQIINQHKQILQKNTARKMIRPKIGVGVFILNKDLNKFLMSKRKDCGRFALMGGHLERFETVCECAQREVLEESNLQIPLQEYKEYPIAFNVINKEENFHFATFFAVAVKPDDQEFSNTEPEKQEDWEWYGEEEFIKVYKQKRLYYSIESLFQSCNEDFNILMDRIKQLIK
ncbi:NUDIX hydrolase (macronuclear) [Tetrahymena thermophila SB210]|uniref:NUDIX hydrolase n=1 Tax=Tetrahymena thermophila (strain SB210) TaxID=312017 RepID=Q22GU9_TETTS|nr:NUDIX hydrolase [Tetrahymena thermophila SB210]EAR84575.2 NUDIX hydrolase [Tetrahymena thermophila SB210]|eukprot:XP_001032238.2 NUDIX hydrolase [Tetrahymena thermophila SB210]